MDYWRGQRVCWPPLSNYWGGGGGGGGRGPPLPTPMRFILDVMWSIQITSYQSNYRYNAPRSAYYFFCFVFIFEGREGRGAVSGRVHVYVIYIFTTIPVSADFCLR